jgi:hypothetical protein
VPQFQRKDFRPHPRRMKDYDIVHEVVLSLDDRGRHGVSSVYRLFVSGSP